jgi:hypothetical protein
MFINVAIIIALISSTLTIKAMLTRMKAKINKVQDATATVHRETDKLAKASSFAMQAKLTMTSIVLILVLIIYDIILFLEVYDEELGQFLLSYIADIFALINPILLLSFSKQVRSLFKK